VLLQQVKELESFELAAFSSRTAISWSINLDQSSTSDFYNMYYTKLGTPMQAVISKIQKEQESKTPINPDVDSELQKLIKPKIRSEYLQENENQINALKEIKTSLIKLRLSQNEVKVYLYLARFGAQKAQIIADSVNLHRTEAYKILRTLENEGIIYRVLERPMKFKAVSLEKVLDLKLDEKREGIYQLEKKREELIRLWGTLPEVSEPDTEDKMLQVVEGKKQIIGKLLKILTVSERKLRGVIKGVHLIGIYNSSFFEELEVQSKEKDLDVKILTEYSPSSTYVLDQLKLTNCDFAFLRNKDQPSFVISDTGFLILFMENDEDKFYVLETNDKSMVRSYENLFNLLWKNQDRQDH
jgi:sugar-specific transcriptional regulator TrmB